MLRVRNWTKFQHYRDRCPPWIKLATDTFQNPEFSRLQSASKLLAICIWTLASRSKDGSVPDDLQYILQWGFLVGQATKKNLQELINQGFIERDSELLACCEQGAIPEGEAETYKQETETESCFEEVWSLWPRHEKKQDTRKKYDAVRNHDDALILERARRQVEIWKQEGRETRFIPMLATWLHQKRYDTEPEFIGGNGNGQGNYESKRDREHRLAKEFLRARENGAPL